LTFAWTPYAVPFLVASLLVSALALYVVKHRDTAVGPPFVVLLSAITLWMLLEGLLVLGSDAQTKVPLGKACYAVVGAIGPALLLVALRSADPAARLGWVAWSAVLSVPLATLLLLAVDGVPGWLYSSVSIRQGGPYPRRVISFGPWYYVFILHAYALVACASILIVRRFLASWRDNGFDLLVLMVGVTVPWLTVSLHVLHYDLLPHIDALSFGFLGMAGCFAWGFKRTGLLGVMGIGRRLVIDAMSDGVVVTDTRGRLVDINAAARRILDLGRLRVTAQPLEEVFTHHPQLIASLETREDQQREVELGNPRRSYDLQISPLKNRRGREVSRVLSLRDITERKRDEEALARKSSYVQLIQRVALAANEASSVEGALEISVHLICTSAGWAVGHVYLPAEDGSDDLIETDIRYLSDPERFAPLTRQPELERVSAGRGLAWRVWTTGRPEVLSEFGGSDTSSRARLVAGFGLSAAMAMPVTIGDEVPAVLEFAATERVESEGELIGVLAHLGGVLGRVIESKRAAERIRDLAFYDSLTGLPNRQFFQQQLEGALRGAERYEWALALLFIGLDGFKHINDTLGHSAGDSLLRQVATCFTRCVRESDVVVRDTLQNNSAISRIGGDVFTVLLTRISTPQDAAIVAQRLIESISGAFQTEGSEVFTGASVGIAVHPHDGREPEVLLRNADAALYAAKSRGANTFQFYDASMNRQSRRDLHLEGRLRRALERGEFFLHYQPQRDARTGLLVGSEALLRWDDPEEGSIAPSEFIPIAERSGLIVPIGAWVLRTACAQVRSWQEQGFSPIRIAVNVSGHQIRAGGLVETVARTLEETGLSAEWLELEITESAIPDDDPLTRETLEALCDCGVSLALDDFGTGSSSLTHLRSFPIHRLKIDRAFVSGIPDNPDDASLTAAVIAMARSLHRRVVAEGVETEAQASFLTREGCDELQGYLFGRPVPAEDFVRLLEPEKRRS
jgi:diguanylate cyclase (GGDEF)-like protein/PAS domain S-box-containing protein